MEEYDKNQRKEIAYKLVKPLIESFVKVRKDMNRIENKIDVLIKSSGRKIK